MATNAAKAVNLDELADKVEGQAPTLSVIQGGGDPAPTYPQEVARQIGGISQSMHGASIQRLRGMRDEIDTLMRTLQDQDLQFAEITRQVATNVDLVNEYATTISESLQSIRKSIGLVAPTLTVGPK